MNIRKIFGVVLMVMCAITINMYGQNEDLRQKYNRLATDADAHPADWKKQYDVAQMLIKEGSELFDQEKAGKFYERIYHVASDVNAAVPDSAFYESTYILMLNPAADSAASSELGREPREHQATPDIQDRKSVV